jgi:hypothetical protein
MVLSALPGTPNKPVEANGDPMSRIAFPARPAHFTQSSIPACASSGDPEDIGWVADTDDRYKTKYFAMTTPSGCSTAATSHTAA